MFRSAQTSLLVLAALLLAGCGFQLQGAFVAPAGMEQTYIQAADSYSPFLRELTMRLTDAGVNLVETEAEATAVFSISHDETSQRVLSVSARNVPTEYEVFYTIAYSLESGATTLMPLQTLTLTRDYTYDSTLVLGKAREEELLREAIAQDLVRVVMKQITTL